MEFRSFIFAVSLLATGSLFASVTEEETFSYTLDDGGRFSISNVNGAITITGGKGDRVEIVAIKKADSQQELDEIDIEISHSADEIVVETELGDSHGWFSFSHNSGQVKYIITVPSGTVLDAIETVNGNVTISGVSGKVVAESVNGELKLSDLADDVSLSTVNGGIHADFAKCGGQQNIRAETINGRITLTLPKDADVSINADTMNGGINGKDFGLEADKGFVGSDLRGNIGSGSASINIDTVNGSIKIRSH